MSSNVVKLPTEEDVSVARQTSRALAKYANEERVSMRINGQEEVILPGPAMDILLTVLSEISQGNAISVMPVHAELTTQEAANLLNVSRPHLVKLLEAGTIPFSKVGSHRRVKAKDIFDYKEQMDQERSAALDELAELSQLNDMGY
jgi:excisionase family DNA binding protein